VVILTLLLAQTVPYEHPYFDVVRREVSFVPIPGRTEDMGYERELYLDYAEDSLAVTVSGTIVERWLYKGSLSYWRQALHCDSIIKIRDTLVAYSSLRFVFGKLDAEIQSADLITSMRHADVEKIDYTVDEILDRLGLSAEPYRLLVDAGSLVSLQFRKREGMALVNLSTGAVATIELSPLQQTPAKRTCLFNRH
jgi:hypothetical protein